MPLISQLLSCICILVASMILGNWFLSELRRAKLGRRPWYSAYLSPPGILIIAIIVLLPVLVHIL